MVIWAGCILTSGGCIQKRMYVLLFIACKFLLLHYLVLFNPCDAGPAEEPQKSPPLPAADFFCEIHKEDQRTHTITVNIDKINKNNRNNTRNTTHVLETNQQEQRHDDTKHTTRA